MADIRVLAVTYEHLYFIAHRQRLLSAGIRIIEFCHPSDATGILQREKDGEPNHKKPPLVLVNLEVPGIEDYKLYKDQLQAIVRRLRIVGITQKEVPKLDKTLQAYGFSGCLHFEMRIEDFIHHINQVDSYGSYFT